MKKIGIFFGSDTGNTEKVANIIHKKIGKSVSNICDISETNKKTIEQYPILLFGIPTWYYGELQCDWDDFLPILKTINFYKKKVAFFGCGDQEDYSEYFCNGMRTIYDIVKNSGAQCIGEWKNENYFFKSSKALLKENKFIGLTIDEDRQPELTKLRIKNWLYLIKKEILI